MQKITRNTFEKGLNTDIDPSKLDPQSYVQAQNVELVGDGNFFALKNIKGLTNVSEINTTFGSNSYVLGIYENKYKNGSTEGLKGFTIFVLSNESTYYILKAYAYIPSLSLKVLMFSDNPLPLSYYTADRSIDAKSFAENGIDVLYFTDNYNELRKLRCEIPAGYSTPVYTKIDVSLQRQGSNGKITLNSITTGGSLLSGTYQFAYRMINPSTNVYTRWSTLTNPVHVYKQDSVSTGFYTSGYGVFTDRIINLTITPSPNEAQFGYYQLAVIENIFPDGDANALNASLLAIETITPGSTASYAYSSNVKIGTIPIEDIVVDYVAVDKAKTLNISRSRLFVGNIEYKNLTIPVATPPQLISGSILKDTTLTTSAVSLDTAASLNKGYFRDEVYRFGIVYFDKFGNKSAPYTLNMSAVTGNTISGSTDMKFPKRSVSGYSILNNSNFPQSLGLSLTIQRHPTWSVGFEIVRQKRIKRVLFQSPIVPMMSVKGVGAFENYPTTGIIKTGTTVGTTTYTGAQPQTSDSILVPKNLFYPELRDISKNTAATAGTGTGTKQTGESYFTRRDNYSTVMLFPQENLYENKDYSFLGSEQLDIVDFVATKANLLNYDPSITTSIGDDVDTNIAANFYAIEDDFYYCDNSTTRTLSENYNIADTLYLDNYSQGNSFGGSNVLTYSDLQTEGVSLGSKPNAQRTLICKLSKSIPDECSSQRVFAGGTYKAFPNSGSYIFGSTGATYEDTTTYVNNYTVSQSGWLSTVPIQQFRIANVINPNIGDTRYGDKDSQNEFISTGTKYAFTSGELTAVAAGTVTPISVNVWGGDCFVTSHIFKVADSAYSVVNQEKYTTGASSESTLLDKWGTVFRITGASSGTANLAMPVAVKGAAQYIQMFLESEYNGQAMEQDLLVSYGSVSGITTAGRGTANSTASSNTWSFSPSSNLTAGALAIVAIAYDSSAFGVDTFSSISDSNGNPYTLVFSSGLGGNVYYRVYKTYQPNGRLLTSSSITVTFFNPISAKVATISEFYSPIGNNISVSTSATNITGSPGTAPSITSGTILANQVIYGVTAAGASITGDSDTTRGTWSSAQATNASSVYISSQYKTVNTDGTQTYNTTLSSSANYAIGYLYITESTGSTFLLSPPTNSNGGSIAVKSCLTYNINKNLIRNNDEKTYFALPDYININYKFNSRIHYSDIKIYNTDIQGFDIFRVSNFFDLEESGGGLTKLAIAGDNMYAIQEKRISYLPASDKLLETADAGVIAVGSSNVLSIARIIDPKRGSQHIKSVVEVGSGIFMADVLNRAVYFLQGQQLDIISDKRVASLFRSKLGTTFDENQLHGLYDPIKKEYWIVNSVDSGNKFCLIYNLGLECWVSDYYFGNGRLFAGVASDKVYLMFGESTGAFDTTGYIRLYTAYTGNYSQMLTGSGNQLSYVIFYVNPDETFSKTFDDIIIEANNPLGQVNMYVERDGIQLEQNTYISVNSQNLIEGTYRVKIPRDQLNVGSRLRGLKMKTVVTWQNATILSVFRSFFTKYRLSARRPF